MDPGSSDVTEDRLKNNGYNEKDILEQPSLLCRTTTAAENLHKSETPVGSEADGDSLKGPITPDSNGEGEAIASQSIASPEPGQPDSQLDGGCSGQSSGDGCSTPKGSVFSPFAASVPDGCETPRGRVFDPFAPCQTCPPTPGPVIPQRIRLW